MPLLTPFTFGVVGAAADLNADRQFSEASYITGAELMVDGDFTTA
jgi:hypothetical protein